jgi:hypothetical protein
MEVIIEQNNIILTSTNAKDKAFLDEVAEEETETKI